tara:strand:+ start:88 stop:477 length:390 start_codon:yes stop_codon:yes gene_type:complete
MFGKASPAAPLKQGKGERAERVGGVTAEVTAGLTPGLTPGVTPGVTGGERVEPCTISKGSADSEAKCQGGISANSGPVGSSGKKSGKRSSGGSPASAPSSAKKQRRPEPRVASVADFFVKKAVQSPPGS